MSAKDMARIITPEGILAWPHIHEKTSFSDRDEPRYRTLLLIRKGSEAAKALHPLAAAIKAAAVAEHGESVLLEGGKLDPDKLSLPLVDGASMDKYQVLADYLVVKASSKFEVGRAMQKDGKAVKCEGDPAQLFRQGAAAKLHVGVRAFKFGANKGVSLYLISALFCGEGIDLDLGVDADTAAENAFNVGTDTPAESAFNESQEAAPAAVPAKGSPPEQATKQAPAADKPPEKLNTSFDDGDIPW